MNEIIVFTDTHIRGEGETILGLDPLERLHEGLQHAQHRFPNAKQIILCGDLCNSGKISEYQRLKSLLDKVDIPYILMCGNHDNRQNLLEIFPDTPVTDQGHLQYFTDIGNTRLVTLDTLDGPPFRNDYHVGFLCKNRLQWLESVLASAPGKVLVFMHHPAWCVGMDGMDEIRLRNGDELLAILNEYGNVAHMFTGHLHRTISGNVQGLSFTTFKSPVVQTPLYKKNLHISQSVTEPGAYGVIFMSDNIIVHTEDFQLAQDDAPNCREALPD